MQKSNNSTSSILEAAKYGFLGTFYVVSVLIAEEFFEKLLSTNNGFAVDYVEESLGIPPLLLGLFVSAVLGTLLFSKITKHLLLKWLFILAISSALVVILQKSFLIYYYNAPVAESLFELFKFEWKRLSMWWIIKLFVILAPFTALFASRHFLFNKFKSRTLLN